MEQLDQLVTLIQSSETIDELWTAFGYTFGDKIAWWTKAVAVSVVGLVALLFFRGLWLVLRTPSLPASSSARKAAGGADPRTSHADKKKKKERGSDEATTTGTNKVQPDTASSAAVAAVAGGGGREEVSSAKSPNPPSSFGQSSDTTRARPPPLAPASAIRGFDRVGILCVSPCQRYLLVSNRKTGKLLWYPQSSNRAFMRSGKDLHDKYFVAVHLLIPEGLALTGAAAASVGLDVAFVAFHNTGDVFVVGDSNTDLLHGFSYDGTKKSVQHVFACRLPNRELVSSLGTACSVFGNESEYLAVARQEDSATVEVFLLKPPLPPAAPQPPKKSLVPVAVRVNDHFRIGRAVSWALRGATCAVGGTFLKEPRLAQLEVDGPSNLKFHLRHRCVCTSRGGGDGDNGVVAAIALIEKHTPQWNEREYVVILHENGNGRIFDVSGDERPEPILRGTFDAHGYVSPNGGGRSRPLGNGGSRSGYVGMATAVAGSRTAERVCVALWTGADVAVWVQKDSYDFAEQRPFTLQRVAEFADAHDGNAISHVTFVQNGSGLATAAEGDGLHVRLWEL